MSHPITPESCLAVSKAITKKGPRVDHPTFKAHVPMYVTRNGRILGPDEIGKTPRKSRKSRNKGPQEEPEPQVPRMAEILGSDSGDQLKAWIKSQSTNPAEDTTRLNNTLCSALAANSSKCVQALLDLGANPNAVACYHSETPLYDTHLTILGFAVGVAKLELIKTLVYSGATIKTPEIPLGMGGLEMDYPIAQIANFPLVHAAMIGKTDVLEFLLENLEKSELQELAQNWEIEDQHLGGYRQYYEVSQTLREEAAKAADKK